MPIPSTVINNPEAMAFLHFRAHPDHNVEVIYRLVRYTNDLAGQTPTYAKRWVCHSCIAAGRVMPELVAEIPKLYHDFENERPSRSRSHPSKQPKS
jgi:hypothetical protein